MPLALFGALSTLEISARPLVGVCGPENLLFPALSALLAVRCGLLALLALLLLTAFGVIALLLLSSLFQLLFFLPVHGLSCVLPSLGTNATLPTEVPVA